MPGEIRAHLGRRGKSQRWLAEQTGIGATGLSRRLAGQIPFTVDELRRIASALGVSTVTLIAEAEADALTPAGAA